MSLIWLLLVFVRVVLSAAIRSHHPQFHSCISDNRSLLFRGATRLVNADWDVSDADMACYASFYQNM